MAFDSFQASSASDELRISSVFSVSGSSSDAVSGESTEISLCTCRTSLFVIGFNVTNLHEGCMVLLKLYQSFLTQVDLNICVFALKWLFVHSEKP